MNSIVLDDTFIHDDLFPFTLTRSIADIRVGILTIREKWEKIFNCEVRLNTSNNANAIIIPANVIPDSRLIEAMEQGKQDHYISRVVFGDPAEVKAEGLPASGALSFSLPWHIFELNGRAIKSDFEFITKGRVSQPIPSTNRVIAAERIFIEEGAKVQHALLNASEGPVYIGRNSEIMEGSMIRGPFALCEGAMVKMGTKIYGATTIGPYSVVGGEIKNSIIFGYSNKAHDGYLGNSVIGEWCNLGAGTSNSNLKNNAGNVKVWNESKKEFINAGLKCGLLMGDYSQCAINTSFNTGTVTGVCCNIFGEGAMPKYIPSFSWGYNEPAKYKFEKALADISKWKKFKNQSLSDIEIRALKHIFEQS